MSLLLLGMVAWSIECPRAISNDRLESDLSELEQAYEEFEVERFAVGVDGLVASAPCLSDAISAPLAARMHRLIGLRSWGSDPVGALEWLTASRQLDPDYSFPHTFLAAGHPLHGAYAALPVAGASQGVPAPRSGEILFDGVSDRRPLGRTTLVQHVDGATVAQTNLLLPSDSMMAYETVPYKRKRLLWAAVGSVAVSAGSFAVASAASASFERPGHNVAELHRIQTTANGALVASAVTLCAAGAFGVGAVVIDEP